MFSSKTVCFLVAFSLFFNNIIFTTTFFYKELFTFSTQFSTHVFPFNCNAFIRFFHFKEIRVTQVVNIRIPLFTLHNNIPQAVFSLFTPCFTGFICSLQRMVYPFQKSKHTPFTIRNHTMHICVYTYPGGWPISAKKEGRSSLLSDYSAISNVA